MYTNKCTKCGKEFETKNPKRVICPACLYPDKTPILTDPNAPQQEEQPQQQYRSYSAGSDNNYYKNPNITGIIITEDLAVSKKEVRKIWSKTRRK